VKLAVPEQRLLALKDVFVDPIILNEDLLEVTKQMDCWYIWISLMLLVQVPRVLMARGAAKEVFMAHALVEDDGMRFRYEEVFWPH
jgi:hypothetical protein